MSIAQTWDLPYSRHGPSTAKIILLKGVVKCDDEIHIKMGDYFVCAYVIIWSQFRLNSYQGHLDNQPQPYGHIALTVSIKVQVLS